MNADKFDTVVRSLAIIANRRRLLKTLIASVIALSFPGTKQRVAAQPPFELPHSVAFVLSGGGARGSFEVGALGYLYEIGIFAKVICGTSVGAINGAKLAEGGTLSEQQAAFDDLKSIWLELQHNWDMYVEESWLADVSAPTRKIIDDMFSGRFNIPDALMRISWFPPILIAQLVQLGSDVGDLFDALPKAKSIFNLTPIERRLRGARLQGISPRLDPERVRLSGVKLRLGVVSLESGALRYVTESGELLERDNTTHSFLPPSTVTGCEAEQEILTGLYQALDVQSKDSEKHLGPGTKAADAAEVKRIMKEIAAARKALTACLAQHEGAVPGPITLDLTTGVLASATMPAIFPAVPLGLETYVDGGVRELLPVQPAINLGARHIIAINASSRGVKIAPSYSKANLFDVVERAILHVMLDEVGEGAIALAETAGVDLTIITPEFDTHDTLGIDPGLIGLSIDYGYMRAADVVGIPDWVPLLGRDAPLVEDPSRLDTIPLPALVEDPAVKDQREATAHAITRCRVLCWELEHAVHGQRRSGPRVSEGLVLVADPDALRIVRALKGLIKSLMLARQNVHGRFPSNADAWWSSWERHPWEFVSPTPWAEFNSRLGTVEAGTVPTALLIREESRPGVFLIDGDIKYFVPSDDVLVRLGGPGAASSVQSVPVGVLAGFRDGGPVHWV